MYFKVVTEVIKGTNQFQAQGFEWQKALESHKAYYDAVDAGLTTAIGYLDYKGDWVIMAFSGLKLEQGIYLPQAVGKHFPEIKL